VRQTTLVLSTGTFAKLRSVAKPNALPLTPWSHLRCDSVEAYCDRLDYCVCRSNGRQDARTDAKASR